MRDFSNIPIESPCWHDHQEWVPRTEGLIRRAADLLSHVSETEALEQLLSEGVPTFEAVNAVRAGMILDEHREQAATTKR